MGCVNLAIAEISIDYSVTVVKVSAVVIQLLTAHKQQAICLALEDAKAIIYKYCLQHAQNQLGTHPPEQVLGWSYWQKIIS